MPAKKSKTTKTQKKRKSVFNLNKNMSLKQARAKSYFMKYYNKKYEKKDTPEHERDWMKDIRKRSVTKRAKCSNKKPKGSFADGCTGKHMKSLGRKSCKKVYKKKSKPKSQKKSHKKSQKKPQKKPQRNPQKSKSRRRKSALKIQQMYRKNTAKKELERRRKARSRGSKKI